MQNNDQRRNVISIPTIRVIPQSELEDFLELTKRLRRLEEQWEEKRRDISSALRSGARVDMGVHEAFLSRLVVR